MVIRIFQAKSVRAIEDDINEFLDKYDNEITIISMTQSCDNDFIIISILFKIKETF